MTTWVPTHAPNLWGHPSWECPSCSCAMHATHLWNVTLAGRISSSGSLLVLRLNASSTPHAWAPRDLGFSLTDNWCVVWDPPLVAQLWCLTRQGPRTRQHILMTDAWPLRDPLGILSVRHPGRIACGTHLTWPRPDHSSTPWACRLQSSGPSRFVGPSLRGPTSTSSQLRPNTGRYTSPPVSSYNLFGEETKSSPWQNTCSVWHDVNSAPKWRFSVLVLICAHVSWSTDTT